MKKPNLEKSFSVEDIHELREYHFEITKGFSAEEFLNDINKKAEKLKKEMKKQKKERKAI